MNQGNINFNPNPVLAGPQQFANINANMEYMNNTNVLASSVNLSSIQSLTDLLLELPIPQVTVQKSAKEQILITNIQQQQHVLNNLNTELMQHYLTHQLTNPLLIAKQQMQEMNLVWTNDKVFNVDQNEEQKQFTPQHEANAFLLSLVQQKNIFGDHVILPQVKNYAQNQQQVQNASQFNEPQTQVRTTRSQGQAYWNPFIDEQQQQPLHQSQKSQVSQIPTTQLTNQTANQQTSNSQQNILNPTKQTMPNQQQNSQILNQLDVTNNHQSNNQKILTPTNKSGTQSVMYQGKLNQTMYNDSSDSSSSFAENANLISNSMISPSHASVSTAYVNSQTHNQQFNNNLPTNTNQTQFTQPLACNKINQEVKQELNLDKPENINYQDDFNGTFSSLGDRVKSKKRTSKVTNYSDNQVSPLNQSNNSYATLPNNTSVNENKTINSTNQINLTNNLNQNSNHLNNYTIPKKSSSKNRSSKSTSSNVNQERKLSHSSSSSSSTFSHAPKLVSQNLTGPPGEKFEAMLNELFNLNNKSKKKNGGFNESDDSDNEYTEDKKNKKKIKNKINGENIIENNNSMLFDITLAPSTLAHFVNLTAKLKRSNSMKSVPISKLTNLLTVLTQQLAIQSASLKNKRKKETEDDEEEDDDDTSNFNTIVEKFELCCDFCLVALNIMTSKGMLSKIYLEECIEQIIEFVNFTIAQYTSIGSALTNTSILNTNSSSKKSNSKSSKKSNSSSTSTVVANKKVLFKMYNKWSELISCLVELMNIHAGSLTDTLVLATTRVALNAFFLENLNINTVSSASQSSNEIQLNALKLTTIIFSQYIDHRLTILEEIIHSISRLSKTKRGRVYYKVEGDDKAVISMFSALFFQLIQCMFSNNKKLQETDQTTENGIKDSKESAIREKQQKIDELKKQHSDALKISFSFINSFLKKCVGTSASSESDFRVLFEDLVNDLMLILHKPNWPAAQLVSQILIKILIDNVSVNAPSKTSKGNASNTAVMSQLKLTSLDHLGTLCSRYAKELSCVDILREEVKESLTSLLNQDVVVNKKEDKELTKKEKKKLKSLNTQPVYNELIENNEFLLKEIWKHLIRYMDEEKLIEEKNLFVALWLREMEREVDQKDKQNGDNAEDTNQEENSNVLPNNSTELFLKKARRFISLYKNAANPNSHPCEEYRVIDNRTAELIIKYLDITQTTTIKSFEFALAHVIATLSSTSNTNIRSRAMKSLSTILTNAPQHYAISLLSRNDLQIATKAALLDVSSSVREATIDLIGKFILRSNSEELMDKYYEIITERILDAGVSVRKRVIKILREICMNYTSYKKIPEICSKIIKRINDDGDGIRKLVSETFTSMWFKEEKDTQDVKLKVNCIMHVVATVISERIGTEWLNQLLTNLLTSSNDSNPKLTTKVDDDTFKHQSAEKIAQVTNASTQIVDVLIRDVLCSNDLDQRNNKLMMLSAMTTIWLFGKVCPKLLIDHISAIQSYLTMKCITHIDTMIMVKVVQIIEHVLPKLSNPSDYLLTSIEEELTKNILQSSPPVLLACVSCLSALIHTHTSNKQLAQDLFRKFFTLLSNLNKHPNLAEQPSNRPKLLRSLFTCGLFAKHFEFLENKEDLFNIMVGFVNNNFPTIEQDYRTEESYLAEFSSFGSDFDTILQPNQVEQTNITKEKIDLDLLLKALTGLGFMFERNPVFSLKEDTQKIYKSILNRKLTKKSEYPIKYPEGMIVKIASNVEQFEEATICCVLKNLTNYLSDELNSEMSLTIEWSKENLKSMVSDEGDTNSVQSSIIQLYLDDVVKCTLSPLLNVRKAAVNLIHIIHNGGIVHPLQLVPYLIAMSSDDDLSIRTRADHVLHEIERKYHGFVSMKAKQGITLSHQLHSISGKRGYRIDNGSQANSNNSSSQQSCTPPSTPSASEDQFIIARLNTLYSVVSNNRQSRRAFVGSLLKYFDIPNSSSYLSSSQNQIEEQCSQSGEILQYICDNLIWLPYSVWDEPLYILHQLELSISLNASHTQSLFKDILYLEDDDDDELDESNIRDENKQAEKFNRQQQAKYQLLSYTAEISVKELNNCLKAFYMLTWARQIFRELFMITDAKMQDYSPNEAQKVWDKQLHRKNLDIKQCISLMDYPCPNLSIDKEDLDATCELLLREYQRFKKVQLTGAEANGKTVLQMMKEMFNKDISNNAKYQRAQFQNRLCQNDSLVSADISEMSYSDRRSSIGSLQNQSYNEQSGNYDSSEADNRLQSFHQSQQEASSSGLKITIPVGSIGTSSTTKRKKKSKDKKSSSKKKKKSKYKEYSDEDDEEDDDDEDDSNDSDYYQN